VFLEVVMTNKMVIKGTIIAINKYFIISRLNISDEDIKNTPRMLHKLQLIDIIDDLHPSAK
jgi:hypothetical protein